jgi:hypothetical protein
MVLVEICKEIDGHDMASLRYLTQDVISLADLDKCKIAIDIFTHLENDNVSATKRIASEMLIIDWSITYCDVTSESRILQTSSDLPE